MTARCSRYPADPQPVGEVETVRSDRTRTSVDAVLDDTFTDGVVVVQDGRLVYERYLGQTSADTTHLLMSISKSVVSCVAGNLVARGVLTPEQLVTEHIPEMLSSGYRGATVRHLLDMRSGIRFSEEYTDPNAEVRVLEQAARWSPLVTPGPAGLHVPLPHRAGGGARARRRVRVPLLRDGRAGLGLRAGRGPADGGPDRRAALGTARRRAGRRDHLRRRGLGHARRRRLRDDGATSPGSG